MNEEPVVEDDDDDNEEDDVEDSKQMGKDDDKFKIIMEIKENLRKISEKMQREAEMVIEQRLSGFNKSSVISSKKNKRSMQLSDGSVIK
ncbi:hypothetical protein L1987_80262 [Smallanthus sonchifolius]|uniref:Uncharacterized protein n=1 Tax=Smallanthus sonchifolius TaxID=185202 RepID=A0ACB8YM35_9ASTR|nr:hypothetical protein L1987_80262 [Smallanthus sonchifolius]